jgi:hypothetical protein
VGFCAILRASSTATPQQLQKKITKALSQIAQSTGVEIQYVGFEKPWRE